MTCEGTSAVAFEALREAATFDAARATLAGRRTHFVVAREQRNLPAPAQSCPERPPEPRDKLGDQMMNMTGAPPDGPHQAPPCTPVPGSEGRLELTVRFLRS